MDSGIRPNTIKMGILHKKIHLLNSFFEREKKLFLKDFLDFRRN
jgi:hypothetical protein